ncbi:hypothetical protein AcV7_010142 [Taiwanofungus camphoratus]|nr:hypothetical protein AcV7_010142 [Antrodia cinnamomea]
MDFLPTQSIWMCSGQKSLSSFKWYVDRVRLRVRRFIPSRVCKPELLSGTLHENLDPFQQYDDAILNDALRAAGLFSLQSEMDESCITLDSQILGGGGICPLVSGKSWRWLEPSSDRVNC